MRAMLPHCLTLRSDTPVIYSAGPWSSRRSRGNLLCANRQCAEPGDHAVAIPRVCEGGHSTVDASPPKTPQIASRRSGARSVGRLCSCCRAALRRLHSSRVCAIRQTEYHRRSSPLRQREHNSCGDASPSEGNPVASSGCPVSWLGTGGEKSFHGPVVCSRGRCRIRLRQTRCGRVRRKLQDCPVLGPLRRRACGHCLLEVAQ